MSGPLLVQLERRNDDVAVVRLDNGKVNALSMELLRQLEDAARSLTDDPPGAVVVTGGDRLFAAGAAISQVRGARAGQRHRAPFLPGPRAGAAIPRATAAPAAGRALAAPSPAALR